MFKDLIEEIERRLNNLKAMTIGFDSDEEAIAIETKIQTYESILELIKESMPQPQDKPDKAGHWWRVGKDFIQYEYVTQDGNDYYCRTIPNSAWINVNDLDGQWVRAILPEVTP